MHGCDRHDLLSVGNSHEAFSLRLHLILQVVSRFYKQHIMALVSIARAQFTLSLSISSSHLQFSILSILNNNEKSHWYSELQSQGKPGGGYSGLQVTRMIEWGQKSKPEKSLDKTLSPKNFHAEFASPKNFHRALNNITRNIIKIG